MATFRISAKREGFQPSEIQAMSARVLVLLAGLFIVAGCAPEAGDNTGDPGHDQATDQHRVNAAEPEEYRATLQKLQEHVSSLESQSEAAIQDLQEQISSLESRLGRVPQFSIYEVLSCDGERYHRINTNHSAFYVYCDNAEQYLDGYRLMLRVINTSSVGYKGLELNFRSKQLEAEAWMAGEKWPIKVTSPASFGPGRATSITVVVQPLTNDELKGLSLAIVPSWATWKT